MARAGRRLRLTALASCGVLVLGTAATAAQAGAAADGGSGTYTAFGQSYDFNLFNAGTTPWQYFYLVGPAGTSFVGGANSAESTARCVVGQPDGRTDEIECGPLSANLLPPLAHLAFVATLRAPVACGAPFELYVSSTGTPPFTRAGDLTFAGSCTAQPRAVAPPSIHGLPTVGRTLTATPPVWSATPTRVAYQWQRCTRTRCSAIAGATRLTLTLGRRDANRAVRIVATATVDGTRITSRSGTIAVRSRR
jgi:hypothetical protein